MAITWRGILKTRFRSPVILPDTVTIAVVTKDVRTLAANDPPGFQSWRTRMVADIVNIGPVVDIVMRDQASLIAEQTALSTELDTIDEAITRLERDFHDYEAGTDPAPLQKMREIRAGVEVLREDQDIGRRRLRTITTMLTNLEASLS